MDGGLARCRVEDSTVTWDCWKAEPRTEPALESLAWPAEDISLFPKSQT